MAETDGRARLRERPLGVVVSLTLETRSPKLPLPQSHGHRESLRGTARRDGNSDSPQRHAEGLAEAGAPEGAGRRCGNTDRPASRCRSSAHRRRNCNSAEQSWCGIVEMVDSMCAGVEATPKESQFREAALACLPDLLGSALRLTRDWEAAQALAQDALVTAYRELASLPPGMDFETWLLTAMVSTYVRRERAAIVAGDAQQRTPATKGADQPPPEAQAEAAEDEAQAIGGIEVALDSLPEELRVPLLLCGVEGMSYRDTARALAIPVGAVRARVFLGRQRLRESLADQAERRSGQPGPV